MEGRRPWLARAGRLSGPAEPAVWVLCGGSGDTERPCCPDTDVVCELGLLHDHDSITSWQCAASV